MIKIAIIIPSRLDAQRLPNKPLKLINDKEMISNRFFNNQELGSIKSISESKSMNIHRKCRSELCRH